MLAYDYSRVTEVPGREASAEQLAHLYFRYRFASELCGGKDVLEVACGPGQGLGYLARKTRRVVGGDYTESLIRLAYQRYKQTIPLLRLDAHVLPFRDNSFDVVILFEAIYYLRDVERFIEESRRILRSGGILLLCSANKECLGFNPSPFSISYISASDLRLLLMRKAFDVELFAAFPVPPCLRRNSRRFARWLANTMRLDPVAKAFVKRLLFGKPLPFPAEVTDTMADAASLVPLVGDSAVADYQVLYAIGRLQ